MKKKKTKINFTITLNKKLYEIIQNKFNNKSKYIEWLVYQDMLNNSSDEEIKNILL